MKDYKELIEQIRHCTENQCGKCNKAYMEVCVTRGYEEVSARLFAEAADAIEELNKAMQGFMDNYTSTYRKLERIKRKVAHLQDSQHYSGTYIKSLMEVEE